MKILLVVPEFPPNYVWWWGVVFENLAKTYKKLWNEVLVITGDYVKKNIFQKLKIQKENNINILRIPEIFTPISLLNTVMPYPFWYNFSIKKIIKDYNPDFIHIHGYGLFMPAQVANLCKQLHKNYIFTIHWAPVSPEKMKNKIISTAYNFYHKFYGFPMLEQASKITAVSGFARDFSIFKKYKDKIKVIWNGINPEEYENYEDGYFKQKWIRLNADTKIILSVGRIEWIKWFDKIIKLLPQMIEKWYNIKYCIAGKDNWEKLNLQKLAEKLWVSDRLVFLWFVSWKEKNSMFADADIVAISSESESYGLVWLEARLFNKPIITTFVWGLKDALEWYKSAYTLNSWNKGFENKNVENKNIEEFYYENIWKQYLLLN